MAETPVAITPRIQQQNVVIPDPQAPTTSMYEFSYENRWIIAAIVVVILIIIVVAWWIRKSDPAEPKPKPKPKTEEKPAEAPTEEPAAAPAPAPPQPPKPVPVTPPAQPVTQPVATPQAPPPAPNRVELLATLSEISANAPPATAPQTSATEDDIMRLMEAASAPSDFTRDLSGEQCSEPTQKGSRCTISAKPNGRCHLHGGV